MRDLHHRSRPEGADREHGGPSADAIFALPPDQLSAPARLARAWSATRCRSTSISAGYSDMAIGLASMIGFTFPMNFNYPYVARVDDRLLAALAHIAVVLVPRLCLHPARRQPALRRPHLRQSVDRVPALRAVARRGLDLRALGRCPRRVPRARAARPRRSLAAAAGRPAACLCRCSSSWSTWVLFRTDSVGHAIAYLRRCSASAPTRPARRRCIAFSAGTCAGRSRRRRSAAGPVAAHLGRAGDGRAVRRLAFARLGLRARRSPPCSCSSP